jgi:hypothetical protein
MLERCGYHKGLTNATKAHPILWCKLSPQRPSSLSTKGFLEVEPAFTILGHASTTKLEAPKDNTMLSNNKYQDIKYTNQGLGIQGNLRHKSLKQIRGESKSLRWECRSRPSPSILQRSRAWWVEGGDLVAWWLQQWSSILCSSSWSWGGRRGYLYPPSKCYCWGTLSPAKAGQGPEKAGHRLFPMKNLDKSLPPPPIWLVAPLVFEKIPGGPAFFGQTPEKAGLSRKSLIQLKHPPPPR